MPMKNQHEVEKLAYAMTRQRYLLNRDIVHDLFTELSLSDYIACLLYTSDAADE